MNLEQAFQIGLPKWPQFKLTGKSVTPERAKEIIFRTDVFLTDIDGWGNNKRWVAWAQKVLGYDEIGALTDFHTKWELREKLIERIEAVRTEYITTNWASSSYIGGPHGWCSPKGHIYHDHNVGKWPSVKDIHDEMLLLHQAFGVEMTGTLMSGEYCDDNTYPLITLIARDGKVTPTTDHDSYHYPDTGVAAENQAKDDFINSPEGMKMRFSTPFGPSMEQGLPNLWIEELGEKTRPIIKELVASLPA